MKRMSNFWIGWRRNLVAIVPSFCRHISLHISTSLWWWTGIRCKTQSNCDSERIEQINAICSFVVYFGRDLQMNTQWRSVLCERVRLQWTPAGWKHLLEHIFLPKQFPSGHSIRKEAKKEKQTRRRNKIKKNKKRPNHGENGDPVTLNATAQSCAHRAAHRPTQTHTICTIHSIHAVAVTQRNILIEQEKYELKSGKKKSLSPLQLAAFQLRCAINVIVYILAVWLIWQRPGLLKIFPENSFGWIWRLDNDENENRRFRLWRKKTKKTMKIVLILGIFIAFFVDFRHIISIFIYQST